MSLTWDVVEQLAVVCHTDGIDLGIAQQSILIATATAHAIALSVKRHTWHDDGLKHRRVNSLASRFIDVKGIVVAQTIRTSVRHHLDVIALDTGQVDLATRHLSPTLNGGMCRKFIGQRVIKQNVLGIAQQVESVNQPEDQLLIFQFLLGGQCTLAVAHLLAQHILDLRYEFVVESIEVHLFLGVKKLRS